MTAHEKNGQIFERCERGAASLELLVSLPLLVGMMLIASNYGVLLNNRDALDSATRDAGRLLMRAPADCQLVNGHLVPKPYQDFVDEAELLVANRMGVDASKVTITVTSELVTNSQILAGGSLYEMAVSVSVDTDQRRSFGFFGDVDVPTMGSVEIGRWYADGIPIGGAGSLTGAC